MTKTYVPKYFTEIYKEKSKKICLFIFVLNEGNRIINQINKSKNYLSDVDIYVVDGGSNDNDDTKKKFYKENINGLLIKNQIGGLSTQMLIAFDFGIKYNYHGFIFMDGNDKDDSKAIPAFVDLLNKGYDHIQGSRFIKNGMAINTPLSRYFALRLIHAPLISIAARFLYTDTTNGFKAYSKKLAISKNLNIFRPIFKYYELHYYISIRAPRLNFKVIETPVTRAYPSTGPVPTKIKGFKGNFKILKTLLLCVFGYYNKRYK